MLTHCVWYGEYVTDGVPSPKPLPRPVMARDWVGPRTDVNGCLPFTPLPDPICYVLTSRYRLYIVL
jgi:hypothetical protein